MDDNQNDYNIHGHGRDDPQRALDRATQCHQQATLIKAATFAELAAHLRAQGEASGRVAAARTQIEFLDQELSALDAAVRALRDTLGGHGPRN